MSRIHLKSGDGGMRPISIGIAALLAAIGLFALLLLSSSEASAQPPFPIIYEGTATVGNSPAPDGTKITTRTGGVKSRPVLVKDGKYSLLLADPSTVYDNIDDAIGLEIEFFADGAKAIETDVFVEGQFLEKTLNLHFPELPLTGDESFTLLWSGLAGVGAVSVAIGVALLYLRPKKRWVSR